MDNPFDNSAIKSLNSSGRKHREYVPSIETPQKNSPNPQRYKSPHSKNKVYPVNSIERTPIKAKITSQPAQTVKTKQQVQAPNSVEFRGRTKVKKVDNSAEIREVLLKEKPIKKLKKNTNMPKFVCRLFISHFHKYSHIFKSDQQLLRKMTRSLKGNKLQKNSNYSLAHMHDIFCTNDKGSGRRSFLCRKLLSQLIGDYYQEVIRNPRLKQSMESYLMGLKVLRLRARSVVLMERLQHK